MDKISKIKQFERARNKIAQDIHDSLAQTLASLKLRVGVLEKSLYQHDVDQEIIKNTLKLKKGIDLANIEIRSLILNFRSPQIKHFHRSIGSLVEKFRSENSINVFLQYDCSKLSVSTEVKSHLFRIIQESLNNVSKHSKAKFLRLLLSCKQGNLKVLIEDDGIGFSKREIDNSTHFGLAVIKERAKQINAKLAIEAEPNEGCRIKLTLKINS